MISVYRSNVQHMVDKREPAPSAPEQKYASVGEAASACVERHPDDFVAAERELIAICRADRALFDELVDKWVNTAAHAVIRKRICDHRRRVWNAPNYDEGGNGARIIAMHMTLLDFPLPGGLRLAHAQRGDVQGAAKFYREQADDMAHKARWLNAIAEKLPEGKRVADVFDAAALAKMEEETND